MLGTGGNNISGLSGDNGAIGVSHEAGGEDAVHTHGVDSASGSGVGDLGGVDLGGVSGDDSAVVVSDQAVGGVHGVGVGVADKAEVSGPGCGDLEGVSGHHGAVGVGDQGLGGAQGDTGGENLVEKTVKIRDEAFREGAKES